MTHRRKTLRLTFAGMALAALTSCADTPPDIEYLIKDGMVFSGSVSDAGQIADIGFDNGVIVFIGDADAHAVSAQNVIDATALIVSPGFIDPHTHALDDLLSQDRNHVTNYLAQGVTTVFVGNDGDGPVDISETLAALDENRVGANVGVFVGHGTVRKTVLGDADRAPSQSELDAMRLLVRQAMTSGALGLSAGLYYAPASYADKDELIALAKVAAEFNGIYDSHLRDESSYSIGLLAAVEEALTIGRESGAAVHIAHIKALGVDVWGESTQVIDIIASAQQSGQRVTADQYPWRASGTHISNALIPNWAKEGGTEQFHARLQDPANQERLRTEISENLRKRGGADALLIVAGQSDHVGKTLNEIANAAERDAVSIAIEIVLNGDARVASFNMREEDIEAFMKEPWVMTSSDGTNGHPRKYASFPRKYAKYANDRGVLTLGEFIHRSSALAADTFNLCDRGYLRKGYVADILVFDPSNYKDIANFAEPRLLSTGVQHLFLSGVAAIEDGIATPALSGQVIRRGDCRQ